MCSIVGSTLTLIKWLQLRKAILRRMRELARSIDNGDPQAAAARLSTEPARAAPMVYAALAASALPRDALREQVALAGRTDRRHPRAGLSPVSVGTGRSGRRGTGTVRCAPRQCGGPEPAMMLRRPRRVEPEINLTPLIDILFTVLMFLILTTPSARPPR